MVSSVKFKNKQGLWLQGFVHVPVQYSTAVLFLHGFPSSCHGYTSARMLNVMRKLPYLFMTFSFSGSEGSEGKFENKLMSTEVEDVRSAIDFLENEYDFKQLVLAGISTGAIDAALYACIDSRVSKLVLLGGVSDLKHSARYDFSDQQVYDFWTKGYITYDSAGKWYDGKRLKKRFYDEFFTLDIPSAIKKYRKPILIIHGEKDEAVPLFNAEELYESAHKPRKLVVIKDADHRFSKPAHFKKMVDVLNHFIKN